jgi:hypothetical protein
MAIYIGATASERYDTKQNLENFIMGDQGILRQKP